MLAKVLRASLVRKSLANNITLFNETKTKGAPGNSGAFFLGDDIINLSEETLETKRLYDSIQWEPAVLL